MPRDTTVRMRVVDYLAASGHVEDRSGRATARLKEAVGYSGGDAGFIRIVALLEESGEIVREVRGKRTYKISLGEKAQPSGRPFVAPGSPDNRGEEALDYDELAAMLLARVTRLLASSESAGTEGDQASWARRRIDQLETKITAVERDLARARADAQAVAEERDALRGQLDAASHNLELLTERLGAPRQPASRAGDLLGVEEQALLYRMREGKRPATPSRAG